MENLKDKKIELPKQRIIDETVIRRILQDEYDKQKTDTNYNFLTRFARAIAAELSVDAEEQTCDHPLHSRMKGNQCGICNIFLIDSVPEDEKKTKVKDVSHKIFVRLYDNGSAITPDMQLHIEDVLTDEYHSESESKSISLPTDEDVKEWLDKAVLGCGVVYIAQRAGASLAIDWIRQQAKAIDLRRELMDFMEYLLCDSLILQTWEDDKLVDEYLKQRK